MDIHYHLLINQAAGSGNGKKTAEKIIKLLEEKKLVFTAHYSEYAGHDAEIAEQLVPSLLPWPEDKEELTEQNEFPLVVVIGGDGTLHQVLNAFHYLGKEFPIGYIPAGSGNDFARGIGLPRTAELALDRLLATTEPKMINLLTFEEKISETSGILVNNFGIGLDAAVVHATNHSASKERLNKYNLGSFAYIFSIARVLFTQKGFPLLADVGGKQLAFSKAFLCTVTNHPYFGGGVAIAPTAEIAKSNMDFILIERINFFKILWIIGLLLRKKHLKSKHVHHFTTSKLRLTTTLPQYGQADGEDLDSQSFDLQFGTKKQPFWFL